MIVRIGCGKCLENDVTNLFEYLSDLSITTEVSRYEIIALNRKKV